MIVNNKALTITIINGESQSRVWCPQAATLVYGHGVDWFKGKSLKNKTAEQHPIGEHDERTIGCTLTHILDPQLNSSHHWW